MLNAEDEISILTKDVNPSLQSVNGRLLSLKPASLRASHLTMSSGRSFFVFVFLFLFFDERLEIH